MEDLSSRNYNIKDIEFDPRFVICYKEMLLTFAVWLSFAVISIAVAYGLGKGPVDQYRYICGLPAWWFASIMVSVIFSCIVIYISLHVFKDVSLDDE